MFNNSRGSFFSNIPPVTKNLIIINLIIWAFTFFSGSLGQKVTYYGGLHYFAADGFNPAQLVTYMFIHDTRSLAHVLFNMFGLFMFGRVIESVVGPKRFLTYYMVCGIGAALIQELVWWLTIDQITYPMLAMMYGIPVNEVGDMIAAGRLEDLPRALGIATNTLLTVGASGAIYGILLAFGMMFPNMPIYMMFIPIPIKAKWMVIGYGVFELLIGMSNASDGVAHFAHLGGMIFGLAMILWWRKKGIYHGPLY
ncbi:MAG: rhomboid family intramembrane serine protease [Clostridium sp.]|nr:rhomboid family intramembrane serine protease [Clostridium sp.]